MKNHRRENKLKIKLNGLKIKNFKGIKDFMFNANGQNISVFADNGKGKTTLMDAFLWALFDKDSTDRTNFTVKPQDEKGQDIHNLNTEVEVELLVDEKLVKIKKMQEEKLVKKRGTDSTKSENSFSRWWDEVPVAAGEFKAKVAALASEEIFKMVTNPTYFSTKKEWKKQREILFEISGELTDEQVIEADNSLLKLKEILKGRSIEDYKKVLADKLKGLKKEHDDIPPRIDELTLSLPQETINYTETEKELEELKKALQGIEFLMTSQAKKADEISKKYKELSSLKNQLEDLKLNIYTEHGAGRRKLAEKKAELESGKYVLESSIKTLQSEIDRGNNSLKGYLSERERLLKQWKEYTETRATQIGLQFTEPEGENFICPTCKQDLPTESKETKLQEMRSNFEKEKQKGIVWAESKLSENVTAGLKLKADTEKLQKDIKENQLEITKKQSALEEINTDISKFDEELKKPVIEPNYSENADYKALSTKIDALKVELDKPIEDKSTALLERKSNIQTKINECNSILNNKTEIEKKKARIEELKAEEKRIANLIAELEGHDFLIKRFSTSKAKISEEIINKRFKFVRFKLFNTQENGVDVETCEALVNTNGSYVPFSDANSAGKINAGIDIIESLCEFYDVSAPIWIDNSEGVQSIISTNSQIIQTVVPPSWNKLGDIARKAIISQYGDEQLARQAYEAPNKNLRVESEEK